MMHSNVQVFVAPFRKVIALLWSPYLLKEASKAVSTTELLIACCFIYSVESLTAFNILLLIIIETDKNSLAPPRLQNICELLAVTVVSYLALSAWGTLINIGYVVSGRRMWRNLKTSREVGKFLAKGRLNITLLVYLELCITAVLILNIYLAASKYAIFKYLEITASTFWSWYATRFLLKGCLLAIVVLIFAVAIRKKSGKGSVDDVPNVQSGTFEEETPRSFYYKAIIIQVNGNRILTSQGKHRCMKLSNRTIFFLQDFSTKRELLFLRSSFLSVQRRVECIKAQMMK